MDDGMPVAMTVAGSDSSGGAGIQADLKTFQAYGVHGLCAVTCVVAESPGEVVSIQAVKSSVLADQMRLNLSAFPVGAMKTGMLYSAQIIETLTGVLSTLNNRPKLVVDPVMVASSGAPLLKPTAMKLLRERLLPIADLMTPNLDEAALLLGEPLPNVAAMKEGAEELRGRFGCAVLLKGGHLRGKLAVDVLADEGGSSVFEAPYQDGAQTHGTGCTLSAAIAAGLAKGLGMREAVGLGKAFVTRAITGAHKVGSWQVMDYSS